MSPELLIVLQGGLAFGAPLALAVIELRRLRRSPTRPQGGGEPRLIRPRTPMRGLVPGQLREPANTASAARRAA